MPRKKSVRLPSEQLPRPLGRPKLEDLAALEDRLLSVGSALFFDYGYGATTMAEVARVARVSKNTLYSRFPSKPDLFRAIVTARVRNWEDRISSEQMEDFETLEQVLLTYGDLAMRASMISDTVQLNRLMFAESGRFPELAEAARTRSRLVVEFLSKHIHVFADRDGVPCRDPAAAAMLFQNMILGRFSTMILEDRIIPEENAAWLSATVKAFLASRALW